MAQRFLSDVHATAGLKDSSGDLGASGQVLSSTGSNTNWVNPTVGTTVIYKDFFTTQSNQTQFPLANSVDSVDKLQVYVDGVYQKKANYSVSGTTLTCTGLEIGSEVEVITLSTATANNAASAVKLDTFDSEPNGTLLTFVLDEAVVDEKVTQVYINGVYQEKSTYSIDSDLVTLRFGTGNAPPNNSTVEVISFKTITSTDGTLTATTFLGDLNGTINTATTATTQSAGNNSTKISTTAYTDAKVADAINNGTTAIAPSQNAVFDALALKANLAGPTFTGTPAAPTASAGTNTTQLATTAFVNIGIANIVNSSPAALDTLGELATALGNDANFSTTVTNSIATKAPLASPTFSGTVGMNVAPASSRTLLVKGQGTSSSTAPFQVNDGNNADILVIKDDKSATFSGNVGIGIDSPSSKLHIRTSTNFNYEFEEVSSKLRLSALNDARSANVPLQFAASEFNFITGNVTIGTAAPQDFYLALRGGVGGFFGWDDSANKTIVQAPNTRALSFQVNSDTFGSGTEALTISSGGDMSTSDGTFTMHDAGGSPLAFKGKSSNGGSEIDWYANNGTTRIGYLEIAQTAASKLNIETANDFEIYTDSAKRLSISSGGDVTLGSANNPYLYMVSSGGNGYNGRFRMYGYADGGSYGGGFKIDTRDTSNVFNNVLKIASNGLLTLDSSIILDNNEGIFWEATSGANEGIVSNGSDLLFYTQGVNNLTISSGGSIHFKFSGGTQGDYNIIGSVAPQGSGNRYAHVRISTGGGEMYYLEVFGYNYGHSLTQGRAGGYVYGSGNSIYNSQLTGNIVAQYKNNNYVEIVVDMISTDTGNRWGSFVVKGGTDNITAYQPLTIIAYSFTSSTSRVY